MYLDFLIPFFFVFAVVFGALEVSGVFKNKRVNTLVALVLGVVAASNPESAAFVNSVLPYAVILFVAVFFIAFLASPFRGKDRKPDYTLLVVVAALVLLFLSGGETPFVSDEIVQWAALGIVLLLFAFAYKKGVRTENR